jgi:uncharacterized phage protein (TIGR02216 family)
MGLKPHKGFEWAALMRAGFNGLGLKPTEFWALTPAELLLMLGAGSGAAPLSRSRLEELAKSYPDSAATAAGGGAKNGKHVKGRCDG